MLFFISWLTVAGCDGTEPSPLYLSSSPAPINSLCGFVRLAAEARDDLRAATDRLRIGDMQAAVRVARQVNASLKVAFQSSRGPEPSADPAGVLAWFDVLSQELAMTYAIDPTLRPPAVRAVSVQAAQASVDASLKAANRVLPAEKC